MPTPRNVTNRKTRGLQFPQPGGRTSGRFTKGTRPGPGRPKHEPPPPPLPLEKSFEELVTEKTRGHINEILKWKLHDALLGSDSAAHWLVDTLLSGALLGLIDPKHRHRYELARTYRDQPCPLCSRAP
jgi:hypothetical protein